MIDPYYKSGIVKDVYNKYTYDTRHNKLIIPTALDTTRQILKFIKKLPKFVRMENNLPTLKKA